MGFLGVTAVDAGGASAETAASELVEVEHAYQELKAAMMLARSFEGELGLSRNA